MADVLERGAAGDDHPADVWHVMDVENTLEQMKTSKKGLSTSKASELFKQYGPNELTEKKKKTLLERM
jgi:magnesium-transporting ATPase (P-type)